MNINHYVKLFLLLIIATMASCEEPEMKTTTTLVLGATGATGKWVVKLLLDQGHSVKVVVRSKERLMAALKEINNGEAIDENKLSITEDSLLDMTNSNLQAQVQGCDAVVSCLGHNLNFSGLWGRKGRRLVTDVVKRVTKMAADSQAKFILMGSDGVANPNGQDDKRTTGESIMLMILRFLVPPVADNEEAAAYLHSLGDNSGLEWSVVRPTDLIDGPPNGKYELFDKPQWGLFGAAVATRSHVAQCMTTMILEDATWEQYKFKMPVLRDIPSDQTKTEL